jgi:MoaA/NifB/PqqE/SkfB family radical SAM enzyme
MNEMNMMENLQAFGVNRVLGLLKDNPETNLPKLMDWIDRLDRDNTVLGQRKIFHDILDNPENNWYRFILSLWKDIDDDVRQTFFKNFIVNAAVIGLNRQEKFRAKHRCNIPWAILMDPSSACNLGCTGCWSAEYGSQLSMDYSTLDSIIHQGKALGTYMYIYSGGEPLMRKKDILQLCEEHDDCMFLAFTNGTLIDEAFADEMLRVKNFIPAISIEGFEEENDHRRGKGTYQKVVRAMDILRERKLAFGASLCYTSKNTEVIGSEEYIDFLIEKGCKFAWFFTYMPVGAGAPTDLMAKAHQRGYMYHQVRRFRETKPIFTMDFWNDGEFAGGCIAGGRSYLHINANGDIEPCAFIHYSDSNIHDKTLLEAYKSPLFMQYHDNQPFNENMLRPCPLLDNDGKLAEMVHKSGAHSTDLVQPEDVDALCAKCKNACSQWAPVADRLWMPKSGKNENIGG